MIMRVRVQSQAIKGKNRDGQTSHTCAPLDKTSKSKSSLPCPPTQIPLFEISDGDNVIYEVNPAVTQVKANLMAVECMQQERAEQRRLEREEWKAWAEAKRLKKRNQGGREEAEGA